MQKRNLFSPTDSPFAAGQKTVRLHEKTTGQVLVKAFRRGEGMPPHFAPVDVVALVLKGRMTITLSGEMSQFGPGEYVVFPAREVHALQCLEDAVLLIYK